MMAGRTLGISMEIGASLGSTFKSTFGGAESRIKDLGSSIRGLRSEPTHKLMRSFYQLRDKVRDSRRELSAAEANLADLQKQADEAGGASGMLARRIEQAEGKVKGLRSAVKSSTDQFLRHKTRIDETGRGLGELSQDYRKLTSEIDKAQSRMDRLNKGMEASGRIREQIGSAARVGAGVAAGVGAVGAAMTMVNKSTGEQVALARALGVSTETFQAWGGVAKEAGFEADHVGDLIEEMNNKLGESAGLEETTPVKESLEMLGLSFAELQDMKPEEQFRRVAKTIKDMPDGQQASSAADILMGGEANKFFGYLRSRKEGVDEILEQQRQLNVLSDEGRAGAMAYNTAFGQLTTVIGSVASEVFGLIGGALAPLLHEYAPKLSGWVKSHKADLVGIGDSVRSAVPAILSFGRGLYNVFTTVGSVVQGAVGLIGGWENTAIALGLVMGGRLAFGVGRFAMNVVAMGRAVGPLVSGMLPALATGVRAIGSASTWSAAKVAVLGAAQKAWAIGQAVVTGACTAIGTAFRVMGMAVMSNPIGLVIGGIILGASLLIAHWGKVKTFFVNVWSGVVKAFHWAWDKIKDLPLIGILAKGASAIGNIVSSVGGAIGGLFGGGDEEPARKSGGNPGDTQAAPAGSAATEAAAVPLAEGATYATTNNYTQRMGRVDQAVRTMPQSNQTVTVNQTVHVSGSADAGTVKAAVAKANEGLEERIKRVVSEMFTDRERTAYAQHVHDFPGGRLGLHRQDGLRQRRVVAPLACRESGPS
eukprot:TRINITY_DN1622_c0_g1_i1.p1 TRINITY_DN1622_c0_g1~~TRINITY_DN1622_c0_g1_i1.p1  ORF type:complete len:763 (+),score=193.17 TRINITY_DN1622_c0_g1_i1:18234-20522(+)